MRVKLLVKLDDVGVVELERIDDLVGVLILRIVVLDVEAFVDVASWEILDLDDEIEREAVNKEVCTLILEL